MNFIKLDIVKTNYQIRTTGGEKYTEVYVNIDSIVGFCIKQNMVKAGVYQAVETVNSSLHNTVTDVCIVEPEYEYEYYINMEGNYNWSVSKECYERVKDILTKNMDYQLC